jgi:cystathionine beta-lyase
MKLPKSIATATKCVHSGTQIDENQGGVNTPIHTSTAFKYLEDYEMKYPRMANTSNQIAIIDKINALENAEKGMVFSSGLGAIAAALMGLLKPGDHIIVQSDIYGGTAHFMHHQLERIGVTISFVDFSDINEMEKAITSKTKFVYIETPSNPLMKLTDIAMAAEFAKKHQLISFADNTFATPLFQQPLEMGIDLVMHSGTKYFSGHSDIIFGYLGGKASLIDEIKVAQVDFGSTLDARLCYEIERSMKTLHLRVESAAENAMELATWLESNENIEKVYYPGLASHPQFELAKRQMKGGFGAMMSFRLKPTIDPIKFQKALNIICPAVSLGGVESLIGSPYLTSHKSISQAERDAMGISNQDVRFSVGIEAVEDLKNDLEQAMKK